MPRNLTYLLIDLGAFIIPFLFSFHPKLRFNKQWPAFFKANLIVTVLFLIWDVIYTELGVWGFNDKYLIGIKILNLPVEEILFFLCIPYSAVFTYHCFKLFFPKIEALSSNKISLALIVILTLTGLLYFTKLYTSVTFLVLAMFLVNFSLVRKEKWLSHFYLMFLVILIPFFLVNGLLTGTGLDEPIVWYNNSENMKIRLLTIPLEDVFYGMLLLLLNVGVFEKFRTKNV